MSKRKFIEDLFKENSTFSTPRQAEMMANLLDTVSSDIYSESQRFVFELIQNADDAAENADNEVHFDFFPNFLIVSHNGKAFDEKDTISLTGAGASTKKADSAKTGYKGIGFKSVFGKSEQVAVFSDGYQFRFDKSVHKSKLPWQVIPIWTEIQDLDSQVQNNIVNNNYAVSTIIEIEKSEELLKELNELLNNGQILLFLRRISKISVSQNGKEVSSIEKKIITQNTAFNKATLYKDGEQISSWLTKTFEQIHIPADTKRELEQDEKTPEKLKEAEFTELSFAAKIERDKIKALKNEERLIFTYLPTKVSDFEFPFLVNGSFLTNAGREILHEDRIWNQWLFKLIAEKIVHWLRILAESEFRFQILQLIPSRFAGTQSKLKDSFNQSLEETLGKEAFIPSKTGELKKSKEVIVDKTGLSELSFIAPKTVINFINQKENVDFNIDSFGNSQLQYTNKLRSFGSEFFEAESLEEFFVSDIFRKNHKPSENFSLIEYFHNKAAREESREWNEKLKSIPFLYTEDDQLKSPKSVCFPSISFENEFSEGITVIHNHVYSEIENNSTIRNWLELLGVKEPSDEAYLENEIIGNIENCIDINNYLQVTRYIFNQHKKGRLSEWHYEQLQNLKIFTVNEKFKTAKECYLSDFYEPSLKLENVNKAGSYVSETYKQQEDLVSEWKTFFLKINVSENIEYKYFNRLSKFRHSDCYLDFFYEYEGMMYTGWHTDFRRFNYYDIFKITFIEYAEEYTFAKNFWKNVLKHLSASKFRTGFKGYWGDNSHAHLRPESYNEWVVNNKSIIPTTLGKCELAKNTFVNNKEIRGIVGKYLPVFDYGEPLADEWREILPFKDKLELLDYLTILEKIAEETEDDGAIKKSNTKRIGLIYNKLSSLLPDLNKTNKEEISIWAEENKILSQTGTFSPPSLLYYLKGSLNYYGNDLELAYFSDELKNENNIEELFSLFGVSIISEFKVITNRAANNDSLQNELLAICPYLSAIIEKKSGGTFEEIFDTLKSSIKKLNVFKTKSLELAYLYQEEQHTISKPDSYFDENENTLYFTGNWKSPTTMYSLIEHVAKALKIEKYQEELRLFLQLEPEDIAEWLQSKFDINKQDVENMSAISKFIEELAPATEEEIKPSDAGILMDNSSIKTRISINEEAQEIIFDTLERNNFNVEKRNNITYTILEGIKSPNGKLIKVVVKSAKAGRIYFTPLEWLALAEKDSQLFVLTAGNKVRNVELEDLQLINDEFHMRFNTEQFVISNLQIFADFFRGLPYTHFIFTAPESTSDYIQSFGLSDINNSVEQLTEAEKNLYYSGDDDKIML